MNIKLIYLAGIIDGEGWFSFRRTRRKNGNLNASYMPALGIANTDLRLMSWLQENFGGKILVIKTIIGGLGKKQRYEWRLNTIETIMLIPKIIPHLLLKGEQAKLLIEMSKLHSVKFRGKGVPPKIKLKREKLYLQLRKLNNTSHKIGKTL